MLRKPKEGKLAVEQELRTWKAEQEQQGKQLTVAVHDSLSSKGKVPSNHTETGSASDATGKKKKKKSLFPSKVVMFFAKRKTHPTK